MQKNFSVESRRLILACLFIIGLSATVFFLPNQFPLFAESNSDGLILRTVSRENSLENYDIRTDKSESAVDALLGFRQEADVNAVKIADIRADFVRGENELRSRVPTLKVEYNDDIQTPEVITPDVWQTKIERLSAPSDLKRAEILRSFIKQNTNLIGVSDTQADDLKITADYTNPNGYLSFAHLEQRINDIPVFRGEIKAGFTKNGQMIRVINNLAPGLDYNSLSEDFHNPSDAVKVAYKSINSESQNLTRNDAVSNNLKVVFGAGDWATTAEKMYFPTEPGVARPAWKVLIWQKVSAYYVIVDAETGIILWRKNITEDQTQTATFQVYANPVSYMNLDVSPAPLSPGPIDPNLGTQGAILSRINITLIGNESPNTFNNNGWITDGANGGNGWTDGNAVEAGTDLVAPTGIEMPMSGTNRVFSSAWNPPPGNPPPGDVPTVPAARFGAVVQMFYTMNRYHDALYLLGFTEQARNFQHDNFGRGGADNDRISAESQDYTGTNGGNFSAPADGARGRLQMFIWTGPNPDRDAAADADIVIHEATHGTSSRLHNNSNGLNSNMARGMGEGWSDFYANALLSKESDPTNGVYSMGGYTTLEIFPGYNTNFYYGIRRFPKAIISFTGGPNNRPHNPLTFADLNAGCNINDGAFPPGLIGSSGACDQVHNAGEIWSNHLWEVRNLMINRLGFTEGNRRVLQVVTDGMKLDPLNPNFIQARDAIIAAASALPLAPDAAADVADVREGFRRRGMGFSAAVISASPANVTEAFDSPNVPAANKRADFDGDGKTDLSVFRPSDGNWYINRSTAGFTAITWGLSTDTLVPGDYDGDGKTDAAVFRNGDWYVLRSGNNTFYGLNWGASTDIPVAGDFDGDGKTDHAVFRPSNGVWYILKSGNSMLQATAWGQNGDVPVVGDYDGDGKDDAAVIRSGIWYILGSTSGFTATAFGAVGDLPVQADYDGDGKDDIAVFRPSNGAWYRLNSGNGQFAGLLFGQNGDIPVPGDYDGDGKYDQAVVRSGTWYLNRSTSGFLGTAFGFGTDRPIPKQYIP